MVKMTTTALSFQRLNQALLELDRALKEAANGQPWKVEPVERNIKIVQEHANHLTHLGAMKEGRVRENCFWLANALEALIYSVKVTYHLGD
jgi:hypothetical protein